MAFLQWHAPFYHNTCLIWIIFKFGLKWHDLPNTFHVASHFGLTASHGFYLDSHYFTSKGSAYNFFLSQLTNYL